MDKTIKKILKDKNLRITKSRILILDFFQKVSKPLDVNSIKSYLKKSKININESTIYRILSVFVKQGILKIIEFGEGKSRYELTSSPHHHHLVCKNCGYIQDIQSKQLHKVINYISNKASKNLNFKIEDHQVEFFGKCKKCQ